MFDLSKWYVHYCQHVRPVYIIVLFGRTYLRLAAAVSTVCSVRDIGAAEALKNR